MKYFSMFSGIGGFELGIQNAWKGWQSRQLEDLPDKPDAQGYGQNEQYPSCVGYSEIDKYAIKVYERHFKHENYGDATKINAAKLPDFDLLVGGFPCQAFSVAGKRAGFDDTRGTLFFDIARILKETQPRHLVLENVKGLLSHDSGRTFTTIIGVLTDLGYLVEWQVLNSKDFGVPQNRERVFIIGHLRGECRRQVLPIGQANRTTYERFDPDNTEVEVASTIRSRYGNGSGSHIKQVGNIHEHKRNRSNPNTGRIYGIDGVSPTLSTMQGGGLEPKILQPVLTPDRPKKRQNGRRFKENGEPSFTLTGQDKHGLYDGARIRRLTPLECERLQGFPDNWTSLDAEGGVVSDTQRYKMCGNAVTVNTVQAVMERLLNHEL